MTQVDQRCRVRILVGTRFLSGRRPEWARRWVDSDVRPQSEAGGGNYAKVKRRRSNLITSSSMTASRVADFEKRPGLQQLLAHAHLPRPAFSRVIVSELESIGRKRSLVAYIVRTLDEHGVEICSDTKERCL